MGDLSKDARRAAAKGGTAMPDGRYPVRDEGELRAAIRLAGKAGGPKTTRAVRRFVMGRARAMGRTHLIPDTWQRDGSLTGET